MMSFNEHACCNGVSVAPLRAHNLSMARRPMLVLANGSCVMKGVGPTPVDQMASP